MATKLMKVKRKDGITQGYWVTKETAKKHAKYELWKDGTLRRVARDKKGHFITWKIIEIEEPPYEPKEIYVPPEEEEVYWEIPFDFRPMKES